MKYFNALGFYFCELLGTVINLVSAVVGVYPNLELGVSFLLYVEGGRIQREKVQLQSARAEKEGEADLLKTEALKPQEEGDE